MAAHQSTITVHHRAQQRQHLLNRVHLATNWSVADPHHGTTAHARQDRENRAFRPDAINSTPTDRLTITAGQQENFRQINAWCALWFGASSHNGKYTLRRYDDSTAPREPGPPGSAPHRASHTTQRRACRTRSHSSGGALDELEAAHS